MVRDKAAALFDAGKRCGAEANMVKLLASEASWEAANACLDTHGGNGFVDEYDVERPPIEHLDDGAVRVKPSVPRTGELQQVVYEDREVGWHLRTVRFCSRVEGCPDSVGAFLSVPAQWRVLRLFARRVFDGDGFRPGAAAFLRREAAITLTLVAALLGCMVLMRFGL